MHPELYSRMVDLLDSDGTNYTVFLRLYQGQLPSGLTFAQAVKAILGPGCVISDDHDVDASQVEAILRDNLACTGSVGAGPGTATLASPTLQELLDAIVLDCRDACARSDVARAFLIVEGHPAYPVFWDFNLFFGSIDGYMLLVGAASD